MRPGSLALILAVACVGLLEAGSARAALLDPNFEDTPYAEAGTAITSMAWAPDGSRRLFLTNKTGEVRIVRDGQRLAEPFYEFSSLHTASECGLLGVAFDPMFQRNGWIYFFVTVSASEQRIVRVTANGDVGADETVIVSGLPTLGRNHDGGAIGFGPDGKLYWGIGDNGAAVGVDDDLFVLASKIGRANKDGSVPNDNPFVDGDGPNNDFIWARGFRNPFTLTWQPSTESLWVNVVGTAYEQIFEVGAGAHAGWDAYEGTQPAGFLTPKVSYRTNSDWERNLVASNGAVRAGGVTTFTTTGEHRMQPGRPVTIAGVADASFNGSGFVVTTVLTPKKFTVEQAGPDAASGGGVATNPLIGGCVAGGAFFDRSGLPPEYQGNLIFGDYNTGRIGRVVLDPALNHARRFEMFGEGFGSLIDFETGPDGDLYFVTFGGSIRRVRYRAPLQGIVVSRTHVRLPESGSLALGVRLARQPAGVVQVLGERESGDTDVITIPSALTFGPEDWDVPRALELRAAADLDSVDDTAVVRLRSADLTSQRVTVRVTDDDVEALLLSSSTLDVEEGGSASVEVSLSAPPAGSVVVRVLVESGDEDVTVRSDELTFDASSWSTPQTLEVEAAADDDASNDGATLRLEAAGFGARTLAVTVLDDELLAPSIVSEPVLVAVLDAPYVYRARAEGRPDPEYSLDEAPAGMDVDRSTGLVTWTPTSRGLYAVALRASNGVEPEALQEFDVEVLEDQAPECRLTQPRGGDVLRGADAEFYGDVIDDVGVLRGEFRIDGELAYTDETPGGHFHLGGEHHLFDTTRLADGPHELALVGYDTQGQTCMAEVAITVANETEGAGGAAGAAGASSDAGSGGVSDAPSSPGGTAGTSDGGSAGSAASPSAGAMSEAGAAGSESGGTNDDGGCSCRAAPARASWSSLTWVVLASLIRRRTRTKSAKWSRSHETGNGPGGQRSAGPARESV